MSWFQDQLKKIEAKNSRYKEEFEKIGNIQRDAFNEFHEWTPLKLIFLHYVMAIYTAIIHKSPYFKHMYYADLFAGSGINKMKRRLIFLALFTIAILAQLGLSPAHRLWLATRQ